MAAEVRTGLGSLIRANSAMSLTVSEYTAHPTVRVILQDATKWSHKPHGTTGQCLPASQPLSEARHGWLGAREEAPCPPGGCPLLDTLAVSRRVPCSSETSQPDGAMTEQDTAGCSQGHGGCGTRAR